ncbi:MAG: NAD-dependent epimerase/dehydratase family protein [Rickettsiaceae bacterium]|nr:MAG: NAD-dependent epimerase/dehydratase family protein [Rickettsiaceae bacterium]
MYKDKILMITGGTGSFGNAILKYMLKTDIKEIRVFSRDEKKQEDMRIAFNSDKLKFYIGDVRNYDSINEAVRGVNYLFHAAALKQVPSCEFFPMEAVKTNVLGTDNVLNAAINNHIEKVVVLSTDKAVYPINAMGMSKAIMEKITVAKSRTIPITGIVLCATRYGNVMGSRGSVIPLFIDQIKNKRSITITDPTMTRFMMSLDDSVNLVLYAFENGKQGDIFVQKSPAATIETLKSALQQLFGPAKSINYMGIRHGEKIYESLVSSEEMVRAEDLGDYYRIPADSRDLNYAKFVCKGEKEIAYTMDYTSHNTRQLDVESLKQLLLKLDFVKEQINA